MSRPKTPPIKDNPDNMRLCYNCKDEFIDIKQNWHWRRKSDNTGNCKLCNNEYNAKYYIKNTKYMNKLSKQWREENPDYHREYMRTYKPKEENLI